MLTVNIKLGNSTETIHEAESIVFGWEDGYKHLRVFRPDGQSTDIKQGVVFVMNENGRTIRKFEMALPEAHGEYEMTLPEA